MKIDTSSYYPKSPLDDSSSSEELGVRSEERFRSEELGMRSEEHRPDSSASASSSSSYSSSSSASTISAQPVSAPHSSLLTPHSSLEEPSSLLTPHSSLIKLSHLLSWVFVPLLMPVYAAMLAFSQTVLSFTGLGVRAVFLAIIFGINVVIPSVLVLMLKRAGIVHDVGLNEQKERLIPYLICIVCLIGTAAFLYFKSAPAWFVLFYLGGALAGVVEVVINRWWKISVHAAGIAGIVALLLHLVLFDFTMRSAFGWLIASIAVAGLLGSARILLGRHTMLQVLAGYAVGFLAVYMVMMIQL